MLALALCRPKNEMTTFPFIAVDVGNAQIKLGLFSSAGTGRIAQPDQTWRMPSNGLLQPEALPNISACGSSDLSWWIGSVNRPAASRLIDFLRQHRPGDRVVLLSARDLPLQVAVPRPDMVGVDRLLDALAANRLRTANRPAVVVDVGTAITVDLLSAEGAFCGGAILPGIGMSARALHQFTDLLPLLDMTELQHPPPALGTDTVAAMRAGLYWGAVGAVRELIQRLSEGLSHKPQVFITGGAGPVVAQLLGPEAQHVPHLTLAGIAIAAEAMGM